MGKLRNEQWLCWDCGTKSLINDQTQSPTGELFTLAVACL